MFIGFLSDSVGFCRIFFRFSMVFFRFSLFLLPALAICMAPQAPRNLTCPLPLEAFLFVFIRFSMVSFTFSKVSFWILLDSVGFCQIFNGFLQIGIGFCPPRRFVWLPRRPEIQPVRSPLGLFSLFLIGFQWFSLHFQRIYWFSYSFII